MVNSFSDLHVWRKSMEQCTFVYRATLAFPDRERFSLTSKIRRAAILVASNIAAGYRKAEVHEYREYLRAAYCSNRELEQNLLLAVHQGYLQREENVKLKTGLDAVERMIKVLMTVPEQRRSLRREWCQWSRATRRPLGSVSD